MLTARAVQQAGRELPLDVGREYDLADAVAEALVCAGAAVRVQHTAVHEPAEADGAKRRRR